MFKYCELKALWQDSDYLKTYPKSADNNAEEHRGFVLSSSDGKWQRSSQNSNYLSELIDRHRDELSEEALKRLKEGDDLRLITPLTLPLPAERNPYGHKNDYGHVYVLAGSYRMPGAGNLASIAALRAGAGVVSRFLPSALTTTLPDEIIQHYLEDPFLLKRSHKAYFIGETLGHAGEILNLLSNGQSVLVVGPGLTEESQGCVLKVLKKTVAPTVIDATALSFISPKTKLPEKTVLTPHPGEAARLLGVGTAEVQANRLAAAKELAARYKAVIVLKGAFTIVCFDGEAALSDIANPYLATAGSGDVLAGIIAAYIAQGMALREAAEAAAYVHGLAGELASEASSGEILAGDIALYLAKAKAAIRSLRNK